MYDIAFKKAKGRGGTVNRTSVSAEAAVMGCLWEILENSQENICAGISFLNSVDLQLH